MGVGVSGLDRHRQLSLPVDRASRLRRDRQALLEVLVRRAVLPIGQRRPLARLALAGRRLALVRLALARALELVEDVHDRRADVPVDRPVDAHLIRDREQMPDLREEALAGLREVLRVAGQPLDRRLAALQHPATGLLGGDGVGMRIDEVLDFDEDCAAEPIHATSRLSVTRGAGRPR